MSIVVATLRDLILAETLERNSGLSYELPDGATVNDKLSPQWEGLADALKQHLDPLLGGGGTEASYCKAVGGADVADIGAGVVIELNTTAAIADPAGNIVIVAQTLPTARTYFEVGEAGVYRIGGYATVRSIVQRAQAALQIRRNGVAIDPTLHGHVYIRNSGSSWDYGTVQLPAELYALEADDQVEFFIGGVVGADYQFADAGTIRLVAANTAFWIERVG